jgi:two-component system, NarL family, nitrate/nitrite response regulator NarL
VSIEPLRRDVVPGRRPDLRTLPTTRPAPVAGQPLCVVVTEVADGDGTSLVRTLHRRGTHRVVVLTSRASRTEIGVLLAGGVRGAVAGQTAPTLSRAPAVAPVARTPLPDLTAREIGVLRLVAEGQSNKLIGDQLGLSALTVKSHLARISRKLGTGDRAELVAMAIRGGVLD